MVYERLLIEQRREEGVKKTVTSLANRVCEFFKQISSFKFSPREKNQKPSLFEEDERTTSRKFDNRFTKKRVSVGRSVSTLLAID